MRFTSFFERVLRHAAVILVVGVSVAGCYSYKPIEGSTPPPGVEVRLALSDAGSVQMAPLIGPRIGAIDGRSIESTDTALVLAVESVVGQGGRSMTWSLERLSVPRGAVSSVRTKAFDHKKTWTITGLTVVGALVVGQVFGMGNGFDGVLGGGGGGGKK